MDSNCIISLKQITGDQNHKNLGSATTGLEALILPLSNEMMAMFPEFPMGQSFSFVVITDSLTKIDAESEITVTDAENGELSTSDVFIIKGLPKKNLVLGQTHFSGVCIRKN